MNMIWITGDGKVPSDIFIKNTLKEVFKNRNMPKEITVYAGKEVINKTKLLETVKVNSIICIVGNKEEQFKVKYITGLKNIKFRKYIKNLEDCSYDKLYKNLYDFVA